MNKSRESGRGGGGGGCCPEERPIHSAHSTPPPFPRNIGSRNTLSEVGARPPGAQGQGTESGPGRGCLAKLCPRPEQLMFCVGGCAPDGLKHLYPLLLPLRGLLSQSKKTIAN